MTNVLEIVLKNIAKHNMVAALEVDGGSTSLANGLDMSTMLAARSLWRLIVQRTVMERISAEVVTRKLLPITIHTLCTLVLEAIKSYT